MTVQLPTQAITETASPLPTWIPTIYPAIFFASKKSRSPTVQSGSYLSQLYVLYIQNRTTLANQYASAITPSPAP